MQISKVIVNYPGNIFVLDICSAYLRKCFSVGVSSYVMPMKGQMLLNGPVGWKLSR